MDTEIFPEASHFAGHVLEEARISPSPVQTQGVPEINEMNK